MDKPPPPDHDAPPTTASSSGSSGGSVAAPRPPRMRARLFVLLLCLIGGPLLVEGCMRFLLFHPGELAREWGADLRKPGLFAEAQYEDEYWRLEWLLREGEDKHKSPPYDELLGWTNRRIEPGTYRRLSPVDLDGRRPVLMYGASFVDCVTGIDGCWASLLEQSPLGERFALLNYGVGGHGCGQTLTLMRETLDRHREQDPIVVIGLVADSDFTRCSLAFRSWPKLELVRRAGGLVPSGPVPPGGALPYIDEHGTGIVSYAWRYLLHAPSQLPSDWQRRLRRTAAHSREQADLIRDIVRAMCDELDARGLEYFFLLFTSPRGLPPSATPHEERILLEFFEQEQIPCARARSYVRIAARKLEDGHASLFIHEGPRRNHPNLAGNRVMFEALARGLEGRMRPPSKRARVSEDGVDEGRDDGRGLQHDEHDGRGQQQDDHRREPPVGSLPERDQ